MRAILISILTMMATVAGVAAADHHAPPAVDDARFDFLMKLEGIWVADAGLDDQPGGKFEFRVTAGGTAVEEREMIGTPMEMLTVYHMDGRDLVGTHYCMLGNQPRVKATAKVVDDTLTFACDGTPGNAASHDEEHVHGWSMRLGKDGTLLYSAELVREGEVTEAPTMKLSRRTETARR